jgi:hypothetical protein
MIEIRSSAVAIAEPSFVITGSVISSNSSSPVRRSRLIAQAAKAGYSKQKSTNTSLRARSRFIGEKLLLAGEVPVDQRLVDADPLGDVVDLGVDRAAFVEQLPSGPDDLALSVAPTLRRGPAASEREQRGAHGPILAIVLPLVANGSYTHG